MNIYLHGNIEAGVGYKWLSWCPEITNCTFNTFFFVFKPENRDNGSNWYWLIPGL